MFMKLRQFAAAATVALAGFGASQAVAGPVAAFDMNFRAALPNVHSVDRTFYYGPETVTVSAFASFSIAGGAGDLRYLSRANSGWGVIDPSGVPFAEGGRMGGGEAIQLDFGAREITLSSISFSTFDAGNTSADDNIIQRFDLYVKALGSSDFVKYISDRAANGTGGAVNDSLLDLSSEAITGSVFMLVSLNDGIGSQGFRMSGFAGTTVVPLPGTAAVLGGGLLLGGLVLRRRRKAATA